MTTRTRLAAGAAAAALVLTQEGAHAQERGLLFRPDRQAVAVMTTAPDGIACRGVALISPGAGGSEQGFRYLGKALAAEGFLSVVIGHPHSGPEALREAWRRDGLWKGLAELSRDPRSTAAAWRTSPPPGPGRPHAAEARRRC